MSLGRRRSSSSATTAWPKARCVRLCRPPTSIRFVPRFATRVSAAASSSARPRPDVVLVGCSTHSEAGSARHRRMASGGPSRQIVALYEGNPNGFMDPAFRAGADDLIVLPQPPDQLAFELAEDRSRGVVASAARAAPRGAHHGPRAEGRHRQDADRLQPCRRARGSRRAAGRHRHRPAVRGHRSCARAAALSKTIYDLVTTGGSLDAEKIDGFRMRHSDGRQCAARADAARAGRRDHDAVPATGLYTVARTGYDFVIVDTPPAFSPEVIATIDAASHLCMVGMLDALSLKDTKIGFETLAADGLRGGRRHARPKPG